MTAQVREGLILEGVKTSMAFCPPIPANHPGIIERPMEEVRKDPGDHLIFSTACWRNYIGTWQLEDGRFYLVEIIGRYHMVSETPIFANWVTAVLRIPQGELLHYVHMGFGSIYEFERHIKIVDGLVVDERIIDNRNRDIDRGELGWKNLPGGENHFDGDDL
jgi:hypothetical protein